MSSTLISLPPRKQSDIGNGIQVSGGLPWPTDPSSPSADLALGAENSRWGREGGLSVDIMKIGERPAGMTDPSAAIVRAARSVSEALGIRSRLFSGSTDANIPISMGIPAITIDGGGSGSGAHSEREMFNTTNSEQGTLRATLLAVALTEP